VKRPFFSDDAHLAYAHGASNVPLIGATIGDVFDRVAESQPDHDALVSCHQGLRYTYSQLKVEVDRFARGLIALGIQKGERLGIWSPNHAEWVVTQYASAKIGAVLVNINPAYRVHELEYALKQSGCATVIIAPPFKTTDYAALLGELYPELSCSEPGRVRAERLPDLRRVIAFGTQQVPGAFHWDDLLTMGDEVDLAELAACQCELQFDDPINIQYTSGTTGFPKGATLSHHSILNNALGFGDYLRFTDQDRLCVTFPFYHCGGMVLSSLCCVATGAAMVLPAPVFDAGATLEAIDRERCTALHGVPTVFIAALNHPRFERFDMSSLRVGLMGGAPCPIEVMKQVNTRMHIRDIVAAYGMTETSPASAMTPVDGPLERRVSTVGRAFPHVELKIVDPLTGNIVQRGDRGELLVRGYNVMLGYWNNPTATAEAIDGARWMHTGDLATMDAEGYVNIVGRLKEMIIRGGENVYPREIEEFLHTHPKVQDVQVFGVPDEKYGEEIAAWIVLKQGETIADADLREYCVRQISHYKIRRYWKVVDTFPMTVTGKAQKFKMREMAIAELGVERAAAILSA
jgi:fatty-acyl-CoA synthase